jgi:hypothetical protein
MKFKSDFVELCLDDADNRFDQYDEHKKGDIGQHVPQQVEAVAICEQGCYTIATSWAYTR